MNYRQIFRALCSLLISFSSLSLARDDLLENIKKDWSAAKLIRFDVLIAVESEVFNTVDSTSGNIVIAEDGRYRANIGDELFLFDGKCIWEVSFANLQATRQCLKEGERFENRLIFLKDINSYYRTASSIKGDGYLLVKNQGIGEALPDSINLYLDRKAGRISFLEYYDLNSEKNTVFLHDVKLQSEVEDKIFEYLPSDSIEVITLP